MTDFQYVGSELDLFAAVGNWKSYWAAVLRPFIGGDVLEVGAGIGSNTPFLNLSGTGRWVCLDPDPELLKRLVQNLAATNGIRGYEPVCGTVGELHGAAFDTILYIDVLEHIENDEAELRLAAARLRPAGRLIVLSPAHQRLYTPFDARIGHFRRYNRAMLKRIGPPDLRLRMLRYLDSVGLAASLANLLWLRQSMPTAAQLRFWDRWLIPFSRVIDRLLLYSAGKSVVAVWCKL